MVVVGDASGDASGVVVVAVELALAAEACFFVTFFLTPFESLALGFLVALGLLGVLGPAPRPPANSFFFNSDHLVAADPLLLRPKRFAMLA